MKKSKHGRPEWFAYRVGPQSTNPNWVNNDCVPFSTVYYICHVEDAFRVFEDGRIRSSLVWDESRLRNTRTCVSWVSPNLWSNGSIYGNIRFDFDWKALVTGKRFYWVEAIAKYNPPAYRILISGADHSDSGLKRYDPERREGPILYDRKSDTWYRNGLFTGEFLVDEDLWLAECTKVGFEDHHPSKCRRPECRHFGKRRVEAGAELFARLVGHNVLQSRTLLLDATARRKCLHDEAARAWSHLKKSLKVRKNFKGMFAHDHPAALTLVSAILDRYGWGRQKGTAKLCDLFRNTEELRLSLTSRIVRAFDLRSAEALED